MDPLDQLNELPDGEIKALLAILGRAGKTLKPTEALRQLKIRILADPRHFHALPAVMHGYSYLYLGTRFIEMAEKMKSAFPFNADGIASAAKNRRKWDVTGAMLFYLMLRPDSFDDRLLTMVPFGTYEAVDIYGALMENPHFPHRPLFGDVSSVPVMQTYDIVKGWPTAYKEGRIPDISAMATFNDFTTEWMEDTGRSGTTYPRVVFTMTDDGSVWSTPPFGLQSPFPVLMALGGVVLSDIQYLADRCGFRSLEDDFTLEEQKRLTVVTGLRFASLGRPSWFQALNLREVIDRMGLDGIVEAVNP